MGMKKNGCDKAEPDDKSKGHNVIEISQAHFSEGRSSHVGNENEGEVAQGVKSGFHFEFEHKRVTAYTSLVFVILLVTLFNVSFHREKKVSDVYVIHKAPSSGGRHIASQETNGLVVKQEDLMDELARPHGRPSAVVGKKPTSEDHFLYGDFLDYRKSYVFQFDDIDHYLRSMRYKSKRAHESHKSQEEVPPHGNISSMSMEQPRESESKGPMESTEGMLKMTPMDFFSSYRFIFPKKVTQLVFLEESSTESGQEELREKVYELLDKENNPVAKAKFIMMGPQSEYLYGYQVIQP